MNRSEVGYSSVDSWFKLALPYPDGKWCSGFMATGAPQFMAAMLGNDRLDLWQFKSLMPQGLRSLLAGFRIQRSGTLLTDRRVMLMDMVHIFNRQKLSFVSLVSLLASRGAPGLPLFGFGHPWTIG
jgi:hypothetical protein